MKKLQISTILLILAFFIRPCYSEISKEALSTMSQCGVNALYSCFKYFGIESSLSEIYKKIPSNSNNEVSLLQIETYALNHKLYVMGVEKPTLNVIKKYLDQDTAVIIQFQYPHKEKHIVTLFRASDEDIILFDVPLQKFAITDKALKDLAKQSQGMLETIS